MNNQNRDYVPGQWNKMQSAQEQHPAPPPKKPRAGIPVAVFVSLLCLFLIFAVLLTYVLTVEKDREYYGALLEKQQEEIGDLKSYIAQLSPVTAGGDYDELALLRGIFRAYSYYAGDVSEEEMMVQVLKAYAEATGDLYAEYYTYEEYAAIAEANQGDSVGIGISVVQTTANVSGVDYPVFQIIAIFRNSPAATSTLQVGDCIYAIKTDGELKTVAALGGYTAAMTYMRGEKGSVAEFAVLRPVNDSDYQVVEVSVTRDAYVAESVNSYVSVTDPTVGVVHLSEFNITTPGQFKAAVEGLKAQGVTKFVFDVRNNPGGDLQSIKAVLSYFLNSGDLILSAINRAGKVSASYHAEAVTHTGSYAPCSVAPEEVGMYRDLNMVVLCNGNTASAAEVFTATLRDYGLAEIVGETTFGKGIMQSHLSLAAFGNYTGYVKLTTHAYVTKCGITYHDIGIAPDVEAHLSEEAKKINIYVLPENMDDQLQAAFARLNK